MNKRATIWLTIPGLLICASSAAAQTGISERGRYLTEEVAHCQVCHTRRLASGEFDRAAWLKGGAATVPGAAATSKAPDLTSGGDLWKEWGERGMARYLETGADPSGKGSGAHMPAYRLRRDDAEAITAYLKSLK